MLYSEFEIITIMIVIYHNNINFIHQKQLFMIHQQNIFEHGNTSLSI